jgi:hypothetical protein
LVVRWGRGNEGGAAMSERFEELTRATASGMSRRGLLKMIGTAVAGATAATVLKPFRGQAVAPSQCAPGLAVCGDGCCGRGEGCINPANATCGCDPSHNVICGGGCCLKGETCSDAASVTCCCKGQTPCGISCCHKGVACIDRAEGLCGCPKGTTSCGSGANLRCCPAGKSCSTESGCVPALSGYISERPTGPGYATACGCTQPCTSPQDCSFTQVCVNGCCACAPGFVCGTEDCCGLFGECCDPFTGCCFGGG